MCCRHDQWWKNKEEKTNKNDVLLFVPFSLLHNLPIMLVAWDKWEIKQLNGKQSSFLLIVQSKPLSFSTIVTAHKHQRKRWEISVMLQAEKIDRVK